MTEQPSACRQASDSREVAEFERVDWDEVGGWRRRVSLDHAVFLCGVALVAALYGRRAGDVFLIGRWNLGGEVWLLLVAAVFLLAYVVVPALRSRRRARRVLGRLRGRPGTLLALAYLGSVVVVGLWANLGGARPDVTLDRFQPPVGTAVDKQITNNDCSGEVTAGDGGTELCHGSWEYPLGTHRQGFEMIDLLVAGTRPMVYIVVITVGLIVPLATVVGVVAGYRGGLVDDLLMAYVDAQLSLPAILVYLFAFMFLFNSMFVFMIAFGLLSWGGIARIVRSETLQRREEGYVLAARVFGSSDRHILRRHLLPNVANSIVPAAFHLIAVVVLTEAGLSFLGFQPIDWAWGATVAEGLQERPPLDIWWVSAFPAVLLVGTVLACKLAGDGLRDVLDPRGERSG